MLDFCMFFFTSPLRIHKLNHCTTNSRCTQLQFNHFSAIDPSASAMQTEVAQVLNRSLPLPHMHRYICHQLMYNKPCCPNLIGRTTIEFKVLTVKTVCVIFFLKKDGREWRWGSYLIQFLLQRSHLPGIGEGDVQSRGDGVDELDAILFSR